MGKGAIDAPRFDGFYVSPEDLVLVTNKAHPLYDERVEMPIDDMLVKNVMMNGVLYAVEIHKEIIGDVPPIEGMAKGETALVVITGRQRVRWAREANQRFKLAGRDMINVPVIVRRGLTDAERFGHVSTENGCRIEETPMGSARKLKHYLSLGRTVEEAAIIFGVSGQTISNWEKLLDLAPEVQNEVDRGTVAAHSAAPLAKLPREDQIVKLNELLAAGGTVTRTRTVNVVRGKNTARPKKVLVRHWLKALEDSNSVSAKAAAAFYSWAMGTATKSKFIDACKAFEEIDKQIAASLKK